KQEDSISGTFADQSKSESKLSQSKAKAKASFRTPKRGDVQCGGVLFWSVVAYFLECGSLLPLSQGSKAKARR
ncbi:MAG: hypothetical protein AB1414_09035, partial [bacterium]